MMFKAAWMWDYNDILNNIEDYVLFLKKKHVTDLYMQFTMKPGFDKNLYKPLVSECTKNNITVHATNGAPEWVLDNNSIINFILSVVRYNEYAKTEERFYNIHLDIEPHNLKDWEAKKESYIDKWKENILIYKSLTDIPVSSAVPFWLANNHPEFFDFMMEKNDHLAVMSYRDTYDGANSFNKIFEPNILKANALEMPNKIVAGLELGNTSEGKNLTFYDDGVESMYKMMDKIEFNYSKNPSYKGISIHNLSVWKNYVYLNGE